MTILKIWVKKYISWCWVVIKAGSTILSPLTASYVLGWLQLERWLSTWLWWRRLELILFRYVWNAVLTFLLVSSLMTSNSYGSDLIKEGIKQYIPLTRSYHQNQPKWFNSSIRHNTNRVQTLRHKSTKHPTKQNEIKLTNLENLLQAEINNAKADYESAQISNFSHNNSKIYKYIHSLKNSSMIPYSLHYNSTTADTDLAKASLLTSISFQCLPYHWSILIHPAEALDVLLNLDTTKAMGSDGIPSIVLQRCATVLYWPLSHLFSLTLHQCSYLPTEWKIHKVIPIFKSGDPRTTIQFHYSAIILKF